jgi:hypothetical protein
MTEAPTGLLAWGQAATYDAADDRSVIAALTGGRTGLAAPAAVTAGGGLQIIIEAGWLGVADCGDGTSAVVGSRLANVTNAAPGPASGTREDVLWCDVEPDEGEWTLAVIPASATAGRPGLPLAFITVPAGASLASQMQIRPAQATLERRLVGFAQGNETNTVSGLAWNNARVIISAEAVAEPGHWYRVRFTSTSTLKESGALEGRMGVGWRLASNPDNTNVLARAGAIHFARLGAAVTCDVDWTFLHATAAARVLRAYDGKIWPHQSGVIKPTHTVTEGFGLQLTVEDLGT